MSNLWRIIMFLWDNREMLQKVLAEIMDLFNSDPTAQARAQEHCKDCNKKVLDALR